MSFFEISEQILNNAFTENGDKAYKSTGSACLDYFAIVGGMRFNIKDALNLFMKAYYEDPIIAIKLLFYVRDIRTGLGERNLFRLSFNALANMYPNIAKQLIEYIPKYGRFDDLLVAIDTPIKKDIFEYFNKILKEDIENKKENKHISLLAKWLPSINTSSLETRDLANKVAVGLGMKKADYRKMLSFLREGLILENNLREKDYSFDYDAVSGGAMMKYRSAFIKNDEERYFKYLDELKQGKSKINTNTIYPYEVLRKLRSQWSDKDVKALDAVWNNFDRSKIDSKTIVVRDGSGSMCDNLPVCAIDVATSLALLFAEQLQGPFKNKFITFSSEPKLVEVKGKTIFDKLKYMLTFSDWTDTNIQKVYQLIIDVYKHNNFKPEDALDRIVIISDMEFNCLEDNDQSTFEFIKNEFKKINKKMPELVFWNVRARDVHFPTTNENGVKLVSGSSAKTITMVTNNETVNPYDFMLSCLKNYNFVDELSII